MVVENPERLASLIFTLLMGFAGYLLVSGLTGRAATVSRVGLLLFLVFYTAYEVSVGVGTGILVEYANGLPAAEQDAVADAIQHLNRSDLVGDPASFSLLVGFFGWVIAMVAAAVAFRSAGASWPIVVLIGMAAIFRDPSAARRTDRTRLFRCGRCARRALARRQRSATRRSD